MTKGTRKIVLTLLVVLFAVAIVAIVMTGKGSKKSTDSASSTAKSETPAAAPVTQATPAVETLAQAIAAAPPALTAGATPTAMGRFAAKAPQAPTETPASIGSIDPTKDRFRVDFAPNGAGISRITFSDFWRTAQQRRDAIAFERARASGSTAGLTLPPEDQRYALSPVGSISRTQVPMLAMHSIEVDGQRISLFGKSWSQRAPGQFETTIVDESGATVLQLQRTFTIRAKEGDGFDLLVSQSIENRSGAGHTVRLIQYGPGDLTQEVGEMMDIRRFQFGYLFNQVRDPGQTAVITHDAVTDRASVLKAVQANNFTLWPTAVQKEQGQSISWFGTTNRYFSIAVHAPLAVGSSAGSTKSISSSIEQVRAALGDPSPTDPTGAPTIFTELHSPAIAIAPGASADLSLGAFAGPLDRTMLKDDMPYSALEMAGLVVFQMGGCCSWCTFAWLANFMVVFLDFLHDYVVFDWGLAIVVLVLVVRLILHPISKKSQVQMQRLTKGMAEMKPELDALKVRYGDDPKKMQQEQMRLYREKGVNPAGCLGGFLPTFLQMPIWIALYAVLYLAFELRQQSAFFGLFQAMGGWQFLGDLSSQDRFIVLPTAINLYFFTLTSINLLPLLMGAVFYVQQKYMTPPTTTKMTPEQEQQQKIMRVMTVVMFPVMLYAAPSGLTLYIMTSTLVGIWESKRVRRHIELTANQPVAPKKPSKTRDAIGRLYERAMERAQEKQSNRKFKERG